MAHCAFFLDVGPARTLVTLRTEITPKLQNCCVGSSFSPCRLGFQCGAPLLKCGQEPRRPSGFRLHPFGKWDGPPMSSYCTNPRLFDGAEDRLHQQQHADAKAVVDVLPQPSAKTGTCDVVASSQICPAVVVLVTLTRRRIWRL